MKYNNKVQAARQKYLRGLPLSDKEQALIEKDLSGNDFSFFESEDKPLILPDKYTADRTFELIENRLIRSKNNFRKPLIQYFGYAAAIVVVVLLSTFIYKNTTRTPDFLYASTSYGEKKEVILPDGSKVILNSQSTISYPPKMEGKTREVKLQGEAYFDVVKNPTRTFIVNAEEIEIKVLGTKFNVNAYENQETITTTLFEGAVSVGTDSGNTYRLKPGEQNLFDKKTKVFETRVVENIDTKVAWLNNLLVFDNQSLSSILETLTREYNVVFDIENDSLKQLRITARFKSNEDVKDILNILGKSARFTYIKQNNNKYKIVSRK